MRRHCFLLSVCLMFLAGACWAQTSESLGDAARRLRNEKQNRGPNLPAEASAGDQPPAAPLANRPFSEIEVLAWLLGGIPTEDLASQLRARGRNFAPDQAYLDAVSKLRADQRLLDELRKAAEHPAPNAAAKPQEIAGLLEVGAAMQKKDYENAFRSLADLGQAHPEAPELYFVAGKIMGKAEGWGPAADAFANALRLAPDFAWAHGELAFALYHLQDGAHAAGEARKMLAAFPDSPDGHKYLGLALTLQNDYAGALREYDRALQLRPNDPNVYYDIGIARSDQNNFAAAIAAYQRAIELDPKRWEFHYNLGIAFKGAGQLEDAVRSYRKAKALAPDELAIRQNLGNALCNSNHNEEAVAEFTELLRLQPDWNMARPCLVKALKKLGRLAEADKVQQDYLRYKEQE